MNSENQKLIQRVKLQLTEKVRQLLVRMRHARQDRARTRAELELFLDDFVQEGHDLNNPVHRELLYEVLAKKLSKSETDYDPCDEDGFPK